MDSRTAFNTNPLTTVYAQSLYELAQEHNALEQISEEMEQLEQLLTENRQLLHLITNPAINESERGEIVDHVFKGRLADLVYRFLQVLNSKGRLGALPGITVSFGEQVAERRGVIEADLFVAQRLDDESADRVTQSLSHSLGGKTVVIHQYVDQSLIGGIKILIGDRLIDGSVATQLAAMRRHLAQAGRQRAKNQEVTQ